MARRGRPPEPLGDPYERGAQRLDPRLEGVPSVRGIPRLSTRLLLVAFALVAVGVVLLATARNRYPALPTSCTSPALALSNVSVRQDGVVRYAVTGPADGAYVLAVDTAAVRVAPDGRRSLVPAAGHAPDQVRVTSSDLTLRGCAAHGYFGVRLPAGQHTVGLFRLGAGPGTPVARRGLLVTAH